MSYSTRVYRQRNAHTYDNEVNKEPSSFFSNSKEAAGAKSGNNSFFQAKLSVGQPNDKYEQEADAVANKVVDAHSANTNVVQKKDISSIQRYATPLEDEKFATNDERIKHDKEVQEKPELQTKCAECEKEDKDKKAPVQMKSGSEGSTASPHLSARIEGKSGKGNIMPRKTMTEMSRAFHADFSNVNIHTDSEAVRMNRELQAQAFTHGNDIYFNDGKFNPETTDGKRLLAHELTHVIQQGAVQKSSIQRSSNDGHCETCTGGVRDFWITFYFRRRATRATMTYLRNQINEAKRILANCCLRLKASFNWTLMQGGGHFDPLEVSGGNWRYTDDARQLGTGDAFNDSRGIPVMVADTVDDSGGGVTMTRRQSFDAAYSGRTYVVIGVNQVNPNPACNHLAHELWHVGSGEGHDPSHGSLAACQGNNVSPEFCSGLRNIVSPVGDFPQPVAGTGTAIA